ncbi:transferase, Chloramphenicol acetyltransferase-like domain protein [Artemisia annua]|uniref:Transferase, Chloramphenicol acetyltransferase-like domain protein n=1 Tax=Artemisia annua TaxID=35608 RepID=A0A2U1MYT0_ARTAN|nr:transferase, Chloramphenicol acetyltransferase-like domain protein [Artemisia annua]
MKWLFSGRKAIRHLLKLQQYHVNNDKHSLPRLYYAPNPLRFSISMELPYVFSCKKYSNSSILNDTESTKRLKLIFLYVFMNLIQTCILCLHCFITILCRSMNYNKHESSNKKVDLEIMTRSVLKPASPTPHHLKTFKLSILDQMILDIYSPLILFIPNSDKASVNDVITKRSKHLKDTLSHILTQFYPMAGEVKDSLHIECNDKGVYYIEARVNQTLEDFLSYPDDEKARALNPESPRTVESSIGNFVIGIQVNIFNCGGIGLSTSVSHKIFDGHTYFTFMKAWAAATRGSPETLAPSFMAYEVFPNNPCLELSMPASKLLTTKFLSTKRFLFNSTALARLKSQAVACSSSSTSLTSRAATRTEATSAIIWKAAAKAALNIRPFGPRSPHAFGSSVNLRKRASPPLPSESIGNIVDTTAAICFPESQPDLATLMAQIRESIAKVDSNHIESMKGEKGHEKINEMLRGLNHLMDVIDVQDCVVSSSLLNSGMYEMDFGWGKPIWFYNMNPGFNRVVYLNDTPKGGGVEATVTLSLEEMEIFERDSELLSYAIVDPSPLQFLNQKNSRNGL